QRFKSGLATLQPDEGFVAGFELTRCRVVTREEFFGQESTEHGCPSQNESGYPEVPQRPPSLRRSAQQCPGIPPGRRTFWSGGVSAWEQHLPHPQVSKSAGSGEPRHCLVVPAVTR